MIKILINLALLLSGGIIASSVIISHLCITRSIFSLRTGAIVAGVGAGTGVCIFIYFGISSRDLVGSIIVGIIAAMTIGLTIYTYHKK